MILRNRDDNRPRHFFLTLRHFEKLPIALASALADSRTVDRNSELDKMFCRARAAGKDSSPVRVIGANFIAPGLTLPHARA